MALRALWFLRILAAAPRLRNASLLLFTLAAGILGASTCCAPTRWTASSRGAPSPRSGTGWWRR